MVARLRGFRLGAADAEPDPEPLGGKRRLAGRGARHRARRHPARPDGPHALSRRPTDYLDLRVVWDDRTAWGTPLSGRLEQSVRERLYPRTWSVLSAEMAKPPAERRAIGAHAAAELVR